MTEEQIKQLREELGEIEIQRYDHEKAIGAADMRDGLAVEITFDGARYV